MFVRVATFFRDDLTKSQAVAINKLQ